MHVCVVHGRRPCQKPEARLASLKCKPYEQIAPVCMYSTVNREGSVTQLRCGYVLLYLPSKMAVLLVLLIVLYILTFVVFNQLET